MTVANFVGLARGHKPFRNPKTNGWRSGRSSTGWSSTG